MFEREIKFITDFNINKAKRLGAFFSLDNLNKVNIHPSIVQYISAELEYLIFIDRQRILQKSAFDYSGSEISNYFHLIAQEIKKSKLLPFEDVKRIILQAVTFNVNFLLRPKWTLNKFIFDGEEYRTIEEIKIFLNYTYFYPYFKELIFAFLEKKKILSISQKDFSSLVEKIQQELIDTQLRAVIDDGLVSVSEFLNMGEINKSKLSVEIIELFLKEKDLLNYIYKIRKILSVDPKQKFDITEFQSALYSDIEVEEESVPEEETSQPNPNQIDIFEIEKEVNVVEEIKETVVLSDEPKIEVENSNKYEEPMVDASEEINLFTKPVKILEKQSEEVKEEIKSEVTIQPEEESFEETFKKMVEEAAKESEEIETELFHDLEESEKKAEVELEDKTTIDEIKEMIELVESRKEIVNDEEQKIEIDEIKTEYENEIEKVAGQTTSHLFEENKIEATDINIDDNKISNEIIEIESNEVITEKPETAENPVIDVDIFNFFSSKETMKIINAVFNNDSVDFINTLEKITECETFENANEIMKSVFYSYKINPLNSKEALLLQEKVSLYFKSKSS